MVCSCFGRYGVMTGIRYHGKLAMMMDRIWGTFHLDWHVAVCLCCMLCKIIKGWMDEVMMLGTWER